MKSNPLKADRSRQASGWGRIALAVAAAVPLCALVVGNAFVITLVATDPTRAAKLWASHPSVEMETGLSEVGRLAANRQPIDTALVEALLSSYPKAPLAPEPFLVKGVQAQLAGDQQLAGNAFLTARNRNPRGLGARYFLADHYLRTNQTAEGLSEISALVRLVPHSLTSAVPFLAAYAKQPGAAKQIKDMVQTEPLIESELLTNLAADPANLNLILQLWSGRGRGDSIGWQNRLLSGLIAAGRFDEAKSAWTRFTGISPVQDQLFDPDFTSTDRPPFGWSLVSGPGGVAEPQGGGKLHIIYYGRDNLTLASQMLNLSPGRYRFTMKLTGGNKPAPLEWVIKCLLAGTELTSIPLSSPSKDGTVAGSFAVPASACAAQSLELVGRAPEFPDQVDVTLSQLRLNREGAL